MLVCFLFSIVDSIFYFLFFFFNDTATTEIYTLSLDDALPICSHSVASPISGPSCVLSDAKPERNSGDSPGWQKGAAWTDWARPSTPMPATRRATSQIARRAGWRLAMAAPFRAAARDRRLGSRRKPGPSRARPARER